jgi:hypothetical protein
MPCALEWLTREQAMVADDDEEDDTENADWGDWLADYAGDGEEAG